MSNYGRLNQRFQYVYYILVINYKKMFILILSFLLSSISLNQCDDLEKYRKAYEYILGSSKFEDFTEYDFPGWEHVNVCVSEQVSDLNLGYFIREIIEYEYGNLDSTEKIRIRDSLIVSEYRKSEFSINENLNKLENYKNCDLILYFSEIKDNKLIAKLLICWSITGDYREDIYNTYRSLVFLFYFSKDSIEKVFVEGHIF